MGEKSDYNSDIRSYEDMLARYKHGVGYRVARYSADKVNRSLPLKRAAVSCSTVFRQGQVMNLSKIPEYLKHLESLLDSLDRGDPKQADNEIQYFLYPTKTKIRKN